jgi:hypothetical protein
MADVAEIRSYWIDEPPPHVTIALVARALGVDFEKLKPERPFGEIEPTSGPSIAELAAKIQPPRHDDTLAASREIFRLLDDKESADGRGS